MNVPALPLMAQAIISAVLIIAVLVVFLLRFAKGHMWVGVVFAVVLLDQTTKYVVVHMFNQGRLVPAKSWWNLVYFENRLLGFGESDPLLLSAALACFVALIALFLRLEKRNYRMGWAMQVAAALIVGGCLGILIDRMGRGYVIDWIDFGPQSEYVYNIADLAVIAAAVILLARVIRLAAHRAGGAFKRALTSPGDQRAEAECRGRETARELCQQLGCASARRMAAALQIEIVHEEAPPPEYEALRVRSEYREETATIVLYNEPLQALAKAVVDKRSDWAGLDIEAMHILHEIYHHVEKEPDDLSETAAHYFAAEVMGLDFLPEELDRVYESSSD